MGSIVWILTASIKKKYPIFLTRAPSKNQIVGRSADIILEDEILESKFIQTLTCWLIPPSL
jgi:hypothetical protein